MRARADANYGKPALLCAPRHLNNHRANATGGNHNHCVVRSELESFQNLFGIAFVFFQVQWRTQAVRADDVCVIR